MYACTRTGYQNSTFGTNASEKLVVKVCETKGEESILQAARNEAMLLKKIDSKHVNRYVDFYEDPLINKTYLVLENAGEKSLKDTVIFYAITFDNEILLFNYLLFSINSQITF